MNTEELLRRVINDVVIPDRERLWTADDVANFLGLSPRTVSEKIAMQPGFPRPLKFGVKRWYMMEVMAWARKNR